MNNPAPELQPGAYADMIEQWFNQGVQGVAIHASLQGNHGFAGHYSAVRRFLRRFKGTKVEPTMILDFAPAEAAQVDFGAGPQVKDPDSGQEGNTQRRASFKSNSNCCSRSGDAMNPNRV